MILAISDPRQFSNIYPESNSLIAQAQHDLADGSDPQLMQALIEDALKQGNDQLLSVAYNLAPSISIANYIWNNLQCVLNSSPSVQLFAFPIVVVVGSKNQVCLPDEINATQLKELLISKDILVSAEHSYISSKLYDLGTLSQFKPSQLYQLSQTKVDFSQLDDALTVKPILNVDEGVHLRFIVGVAYSVDGNQQFLANNYNNLGLELLQFMTSSLAASDTTIFPLPFAPCNLSEATLVGEQHLKEINISFRLSNLVKKLRLVGKYPAVKLSSQKNNIQIELWLADKSEAEEVLIWQLQRADDFAQVTQILADLFSDMQLEVSYYAEHDHEH